jgi:hypothetical protein
MDDQRRDAHHAIVFEDEAPSDGTEAWPPLEDWGLATPSALAQQQYVEDLGVRPSRILLVGAVEGVGKTYAIDGELAIRLAVAAGRFAGTWPVLRTGAVVTLSEMHRDDDLLYRDTVLASLKLTPAALVGRYWHQSLMLAAGGEPALVSAAWRNRIIADCREKQAIALIIDTATTASGGLEPWGPKLIALFHEMRVMLQVYPELAIVLVVHLRKPNGRARGERAITDVLGDWSKWCDALVLMVDVGRHSRKLSTFKRIGRPRRVIAERQGGLLVRPQDVTDKGTGGPKVATDRFVEAIRRHAGITLEELSAALKVTQKTIKGYAAAAEAEGLIRSARDPGRYGKLRLYADPVGLTLEDLLADEDQEGWKTGNSVERGVPSPLETSKVG